MNNDSHNDLNSDWSSTTNHLSTWGETLFHARKQAGYDLNEVVRKLILSKAQVLALENGSLAPFHNRFFYFKALKKYQTFLKVELSPEIDSVYAEEKTPKKIISIPTPKASFLSKPRFNPKQLKLSLISGFFLVFFVMAIWLLQNPSETTSPANINTASMSTVTPTPSNTTTSFASPDSPALSHDSSALESKEPTQDNEALTLANAPATNAKTSVAHTETGMLRLTFSGSCWVQSVLKNGETTAKVYDSGMVFDEKIANLQSLTIGNATAAQLNIGERVIDLNSFVKTNSSVARLTEQHILSLQ